MDVAVKAKIRRRGRGRFLLTALALVVFAALLFVWRYQQGRAGDGTRAAHLALEGKAVQLNNEFVRFYIDRPRRLIECPPPGRGGNLAAWAATVQKEIGQPAAVFLRSGRSLSWPGVADKLQDGVALAEPSFLADSVSGNRDHPDRYGTMLVSHWSVPREATGPMWQIWMVGRAKDSLRWGVVVRQSDVWPVFFKRLARPRGTWSLPRDFNDPAWVLKNTLALPCSEAAPLLTGLRAFDESGRVLFASPGLDTTRLVYRSDSKDGRVVDYYQSRPDAERDAEAARNRLPWSLVLFPLLAIALFYRWHREVRRLTEPETPPSHL